MTEQVSRDNVMAFRLGAHHLTTRLDEHGLACAAGACGIQNSPPGSALLALHARGNGVTSERVDRAVADEKILLQTWCMRGSPFFVATDDVPVFTSGVLPPTEEGRRHFLLGAGPSVDRLGMSLTEAVELTAAEIGDVLTGHRLAIDELGAELAHRIACTLPQEHRDVWNHNGPYATTGQPLGEGVVHFCLRILALEHRPLVELGRGRADTGRIRPHDLGSH